MVQELPIVAYDITYLLDTFFLPKSPKKRSVLDCDISIIPNCLIIYNLCCWHFNFLQFRPVLECNNNLLGNFSRLFMHKNQTVSISQVAMPLERAGLSLSFRQNAVSRVLGEHLSMSKVCAEWVLRKLTPKMKNARTMINTTLLTRYNADLDEAWFHYYNPESKFESTERKHAGSSRRKLFNITCITTKLMTTVI